MSPYVLSTTNAASITSLLTVDHQARPDKSVDIVGSLRPRCVREGRQGCPLHEPRVGGRGRSGNDHGEKGAFVSRNVIDPATGGVQSTTDLIQDVSYYDYTSGSYAAASPTGTFTAAFNRFCSGSLTDPSVLARPGDSQYGYDGQVYLGNEENGDPGRSFGITADGLAAHCRASGSSHGRTPWWPTRATGPPSCSGPRT